MTNFCLQNVHMAIENNNKSTCIIPNVFVTLLPGTTLQTSNNKTGTELDWRVVMDNGLLFYFLSLLSSFTSYKAFYDHFLSPFIKA